VRKGIVIKMKKIEQRTVVCMALVLVLALGLSIFLFQYVFSGSKWVSAAFNRHLYNTKGQLSVGRIFDRDGDLLSWVDDDGQRQYYDSATVRKATLHAVGDSAGNIGTSALVSFADKLSGYNLFTGAYTPLGQGNDLYLTLDARYNYIAYQALGGKNAAVGVYNYKTGEILCMLSTPAFDPVNPPEITEGDSRWDGVYLNRFLSGTFTPGSVFKTVTLAAAIEHCPDLFTRTFQCTGSVVIGGETVTCPHAHGEMEIGQALVKSCNGVFAQLSVELGASTMNQYAQRAGLTSAYQIDGITTAVGRFDVTGSSEGQLGWAGVGQSRDLVNPCALMVYMGAIAGGGRTAIPHLILKVENGLNLPVPGHFTTARTNSLVNGDTAALLADMMARNVTEGYGAQRFPNMDICAKTGTAEVGDGKAPHSWFAGFLRNEDAPYAFVVLVENGGSGADAAATVAAQVLDAIVNGY